MNSSRLLALGGLIFLVAAVANAQLEVPSLEQRVTDFTNSLSFNEWRTLESRLQRFEDSTSTQIAVLLISSLKGEAIEDYSMQVFEKNKLGQKSKDNGVLVVIAKDDKKARIDVGYGLEGVLTDAMTFQIITDEMAPSFRANNFYAGVTSGVSAIMAATAGEYKVKPRGGSAPLISSLLVVFFVGFFLVFFLPLLATKRRYLIGSSGAFYNSGWGWRSGGGGGGGLGGGGFSGGGWSGGGGMAGGGGASGSW
jgi:uncharacterized protein